MLTNKLTGAGAADKTYIEDVFSTYLYTGNGSTQTITNGIDLAGKGGMVWAKSRSNSYYNCVTDTDRGTGSVLITDMTLAQQSLNWGSFTSSGFTVSDQTAANNAPGSTYASWTFRKAPKFFDVVTYTGNGSTDRVISHNLGIKPGMFIVKAINQANSWYVYHRSLGSSDYYPYPGPYANTLWLNNTDAELGAGYWGSHSDQTDTTIKFGRGNQTNINQSGIQYVVYLFAHDTTADGLIQCGSYTGNGSASGPTINLGWEPQYVLVKRADSTGDWYVMDTMRGLTASSAVQTLYPNLSAQENGPYDYLKINATGFQATTTYGQINGSGGTFIYMAIRRGPMRTPTDGTKVFKPVSQTPSGTTTVTTGFPVDLSWSQARNDPSWAGMNSPFDFDRLRGSTTRLNTGSTGDEYTFTNGAGIFFDNNSSIKDTLWNTNNSVTTPVIYWNLRRAPGFFDVVCYTGTGSPTTVKHNLGVAPELIIIKGRNSPQYWVVEVPALGVGSYMYLNVTDQNYTDTNIWSQLPTSTNFSVGAANSVNNGTNPVNYVAYLFASCPGVSKVGSYTGNGSSQTINCGFTNGARFVMVKRTDSTGDWWVFDTARGITSGNDPALRLNDTGSELTGFDFIAPHQSGFTIYDGSFNTNTSGATYIYLAIA